MSVSEYYNKLLENCEENLKNGIYNYVPNIFNVFFENDDNMKLRAAEYFEKLLGNTSFKSICKIQNQRRWYDEYYGYLWCRGNSYNVKDFLTYQMSDNQKFAVIVFASFHANGYIRESALKLLKQYDNSLSYIVFRVNDWVKSIREIAEDIFIEKLYSVSEEELIKALPYIHKLYYSTRRNYYTIDLINKRFNSDSGIIALTNGLKSKDMYTRKICVSLLLKMPDIDKNILANHLLKEKEPFLRQRIYLNLIKNGYNALEISEKLIKDKFPINRTMALRYIYEHDRKNSLDKALSMLLDKDTQVRDLSQRIVKELSPDTDIHEVYLKSINSKKQVAILGLSETGNSNDCVLIEKYLYSDKPIIISSAMIALLRLDLKKYQNQIVEMLLSEYCGVVKTAKLLIEKYYIQEFERIYEIYQISDSVNTKIKCLSLLFKAIKWQRLIYMLKTLSDNNADIRKLSLSAINAWIDKYNRSLLAIKDSERILIKELISKNEKYLGKYLVRTLLFLVK